MMMISTTNNGNDGGSSGTGNGGSGDHANVVTNLHDSTMHKNNNSNNNNNNNNNGGGGGDSDAHLKKGPWTAEEDAILVEYVRKHGEGNWNAVQRHSGLARCGKSCRLRWANHLRPNLKKGAFSPEEERLIVELHAKFGNKWARMASLLPGRTDNEIKNYWNTRVKRHQRQGLPLYPPDIQAQHPPSPHFHHHHHQKSHSISIPTTPTSSFTFQTHHFQSPPHQHQHHHHLQHHHPHTPTSATPPPLSPTTTSTSFPTLPLFDFSQTHHHHNHNASSHSTPTTPTSSFSFQTHHLHSPTPPTHHHSHTNNNALSSPPPPLSPLSSPSTTPSNTNFPTLPLFDFNLPRTPPILQTPMRFKRFSSTPNLSVPSNMNNNNNNNTNCQYSTLPSASPHNTSPMGGHCYNSLMSGGGSGDFHDEMQKENQEMCSLLAAVTQQQELPSNQFMSPTNNRNMGVGVAANGSKFGRRVTKKKIGNSKVNGRLGFALEDLFQEAKVFTDCGQPSADNSNMVFQEQKNKLFIPEGFGTHWDHSNSLELSSGFDPKLDVSRELNAMPEDLTKVLNNLPSSMQPELYSDSADISNGPSSVVTDDNIGFEMQQIASLFPPADHGRTLGSCPWDNLPGIC